MSNISKITEILGKAKEGQFISLKYDGSSTDFFAAVVQLGTDKVQAVKSEDWEEGWPKEEPTDLGPLCFTAVDAGATIALKCNGTSLKSSTFQTSTDGNTWSDYTYETNITLANAGDKIYFKAKSDNTGIIRNPSNYLQFTTSQNAKMVDVSGNVMSLLAPEFKDLKDLSTIRSGNAGTYEFYRLFYNCKNIKTCKDLVLPATTLANSCYSFMFQNCTSLTAAPELLATILDINCCQYMFSGCTSLTSAPELPAQTLTDNCYSSMFEGCTSLTSAPELPAQTLTDNCYDSMFLGCTSLTSAPELPATTLATQCYIRMFSGCSSLTSAPALPATTLATQCYAFMFSDCSSLTSAPALPATTLANYCYFSMFSGCTSLNKIEVAFTTWNPTNYTRNWLQNVSSTGTFICPEELDTSTRDASHIPEGWTIQHPKNYFRLTSLEDGNEVAIVKNDSNADVTLEYSVDDGSSWIAYTIGTGIPLNTNDFVLFRGNNSTFSQSSYNYYNVTATKTFNASGNIMSLLDKSCKLISLDGKNFVFYNLFNNNNNLVDTSDLSLPATTLATSCYSYMFSGCTSLTSAPELPVTALASNCYSRMFNGCTSLTSAPTLPAQSLVSGCYSYMFYGCTSLTTAPELPAQTLDNSCYSNMFNSCTSLTSAPALPAQTLASYCYSNMFRGCTSLTSAPELSATTLATYCYSSMFRDCTSLTTAPALPAQTLASYCYSNMFNNCSNLNIVKVSFIAWDPSNATSNWLTSVSSTGTFICPEELDISTRDESHIPSGWTIVTK